MREYQRTLNLDADHILFSLAFCARLRLFEELWEPLDVDEVTHVEPLASLARTAGPPVPIYRQSGYLCTGGRDRALREAPLQSRLRYLPHRGGGQP
jgi:hypothetical protein